MKYLILLLFLSTCFSCAEVKSYQKQYLNDPDMALSPQSIEQFETNFHTYREASSGANSGKSGGGCGCN